MAGKLVPWSSASARISWRRDQADRDAKGRQAGQRASQTMASWQAVAGHANRQATGDGLAVASGG